jgi:hypothetical protein
MKKQVKYIRGSYNVTPKVNPKNKKFILNCDAVFLERLKQIKTMKKMSISAYIRNLVNQDYPNI